MKQNKLSKTYPIILLIFTLFMCVGYAVVNSVTLDIRGTAIAKKAGGIIITDVSYVSDVNADVENSQVINIYKNTFSSGIKLSNTDINSSITYLITLYNSSNYDYYFDKVDYLIGETTYSNENIIFKLDGITKNDLLKKDENKSFYITFYYKDTTLPSSNVLNSYLNFKFSLEFYGMDDLNKITEDDCKNINASTNGTIAGTYEELYSDNNGQLEYDIDGSLVFDEDNPILLKKLDVSNQTYAEGYSLDFTIKADVINNSVTFGRTICAIDGNVNKFLAWLSVYKGYLYVYSYYQGNAYQDLESEKVEKGFASYNISKYSNKIFNIQVVGVKNGLTTLYINGEKKLEFESGDNDIQADKIVIGELRPLRNLKFVGNIYDFKIYDRSILESEVKDNWNLIENKWKIE